MECLRQWASGEELDLYAIVMDLARQASVNAAIGIVLGDLLHPRVAA